MSRRARPRSCPSRSISIGCSSSSGESARRKYRFVLRTASSRPTVLYAVRHLEGSMAEQVEDLVPGEAPARGGSFLFEPVGARSFMTPEKLSGEQRQFFHTGHEFL